MEINYEKLNYQDEAVNSVINTLSGYDSTVREIITDDFDALDASVKKTLFYNKQKYPGKDYLFPFPQFNIEMETGTGKTMVYLQTIMKIHKQFNENKFIIVVPSRAIKTGLEDNLNSLKDYLSVLINSDKYHYFTYDSKQLSSLQNFTGNSFEIMITTIQAFNKNNNVINQEYNEGFFGGRPLDQIKESNPIVIIDEPQSVDGAEAGKKAIKSLNPKLVLRYSATHKEKKYPLLYEFGPVQAYKSGMVKRIEVLGTEVNTDGNIPLFELKEKPEIKNGKLQAKIIAYKMIKDHYEKRVITLHHNDSLSKKSKNNKYEPLGKVIDINSSNNFVEFENGKKAELDSFNAEHEIWIHSQLRSLIKDHLNRELKLQKQGIKVLSLIFLDSVDNYRLYTNDGPKKGKYAILFEKIYDEVIKSNPNYKKLYDYNVPASDVHDGYFAMDKDKKGKPSRYRDTKGNGDSLKDETAYESIMNDKNRLLTQYNPKKSTTYSKSAKLRFIFSHSALKEGWDNPNVFQIFTMTSPKNDLTRRQKIGRGLRIPVNQDGKRIYDDNNNFVTIYANESFEDFALGLQNEYVNSGTLDNKINYDFFEGLVVNKINNNNYNLKSNDFNDENDVHNLDFKDDDVREITCDESKIFVKSLNDNNIINNKEVNLKKLKNLNNENKLSIINDTVEEGLDYNLAKTMIDEFIVKFSSPEPFDGRKREIVKLTNKDNPYLNELWNEISKKVDYHVEFNEKDLIYDIVNGDAPLSNINVSKMSSTQTRARLKLMENRIDNHIISKNNESFTIPSLPIIDVCREIADKSGLTKQAITKIILETYNKDNSFIDKIKNNPSLFVNRSLSNIKLHQRKMLSKSLVYVQNGKSWSKNKLKEFDSFGNNLWKVPNEALSKTLFNKIKIQSNEEKDFADSLAYEEKVKYFLKLPDWFKIPTPFGNYVPDWAVLLNFNGDNKLYFVIDTKSTVEEGELSPKEQDRIKSGRKAYDSDGFDKVFFKAPVKVIGDLNI